ncbi:hypothetical protein AAZX31_13G092300 [Glycine max]|uniref:Growth-regulating factor n=1 Tax=Glycine max TaxID=3847 RepID=K7LZ01_SOYBN|nr:hypothetical protein GYH30_035813 [Glycine max]KAH1216353.1 Growth-regulating factor 3 [Glycine max]KRH19279.1 hypothetical protein GLYMA_13G109500v4 [Glycine max]
MNGRNVNTNRFPFTPSQWQELEHQALIYKYMASGISIPPDLLFTIKRTTHLDSSRLLPHHPQHFGWNYLPMGLGRKIDPEPGRCRRTDGKKWRCSKEAYPDSKYCERHMHRGKNRSRKPVEVLKTTPTTAAVATNTDASTPTTILSITKNSPAHALSPTTHSLSHDTYHHHHHHPHPQQHSSHSFLYHHSSRPSSGAALSFQDNSAPLFLDTASCSQNNNNTDCRYVYGLKEEVDEHAFFTEPSGTMRSFSASSMEDSWQLTPLTISSSSSSKQRNCSGLSNDNNEYSYLQLQSLNGNNSKQPQQDQGCYISGSDVKCETFMKLGKEEPQKTVHRFFDEWPPKSRGSWLDLDDKSSTTQLSISIPTSTHDFATFNSTTQRDG